MTNAKAHFAMGLAEIVDPLGQALVSLLQRLTNVGKARVHVPAHVLDPLQQQLMALRTLRLRAAQLWRMAASVSRSSSNDGST